MKEIFAQIKRLENTNFTEGQNFSFIIPAVKHQAENLFDDILKDEIDKLVSNDVIKMGESYKITVKPYMTELQFDFHDKWNNGKPMPLCIMQGKAIKETRGMIYMELEGKAEPSAYCFCCGRSLKNPVSKLYGIGPECSRKVGILRIETEEEAKEKWSQLVEEIGNIKWSGWVIKKAIKDWEVI